MVGNQGLPEEPWLFDRFGCLANLLEMTRPVSVVTEHGAVISSFAIRSLRDDPEDDRVTGNRLWIALHD